MQVAEHAERDAPDRVLRHAHEDHVAQFLNSVVEKRSMP